MHEPFSVGDKVFLRKITMILTGKVVNVSFDGAQWWVELVQVAWIADTGRYAQAISTGKFNEVEPYPDEMIVKVPLADLVDGAVVDWDLPRKQK